MSTTVPRHSDVMQVCSNGHVITDLLHTFPERALGHCDRCGAATIDRCRTCGQEIPGAVYTPQAVPIGLRRPPEHCAACGAAFPWTAHRRPPGAPSTLSVLESLLRRLPLVVRQLRERQKGRPPFRVDDEHDLEDLLRALLPLHFDDIRYERRTPLYSLGARTDFILAPSGLALMGKRASAILREELLREQLCEDVAYYQHKDCRTLVACILDSEGFLVDPRQREIAWAGLSGELQLRPVIVS